MPYFWQSNVAALDGWHGAVAEQFLNIRVPSEARFAEHLLARRLVKKIELAGVNFIHFQSYKYRQISNFFSLYILL